MDVPHAYLGFVLPNEFSDAFRQSLGNPAGGARYEVISILRLPCGWKYSRVSCQMVLQLFMKDFTKWQTLMLHYLDDFMVLGNDKLLVAQVSKSSVSLLVAKGWLMSGSTDLN